MAHYWTTLRIDQKNAGLFLKDPLGRHALPRGVNLSSESKLPKYCHDLDGRRLYRHLGQEEKRGDAGDFYAHYEDVSFLDRPFSIADAKIGRHMGGGGACRNLYDEEYIDYLIELIKLMPAFGIVCCIDIHQDCWSRFSGGSGAPAWTLQAAGFDLEALHASGAAYLEVAARAHGEKVQDQIWPTNYSKLACRTMFTLFWAGDELAPKLRVVSNGPSIIRDKEDIIGGGIGTFLQNCYIKMVTHLASRLAACTAVVAFDVMNEPHPGFLELADFYRSDELVELHYGMMPNAVQSLALGAGYPQEINIYDRSFPGPTKQVSKRRVNSGKSSAWKKGFDCLWREHGVWEMRPDRFKNDYPVILKQNYFRVHSSGASKGKTINMWNDYYLPFVMKLCDELYIVQPTLAVMIEPIPNEFAPPSRGKWPQNLIWSPHWYDLNALFSKSLGPITLDVQLLSRTLNIFENTFFGRRGAARNYGRQIHKIVLRSTQADNRRPTIIGECGLPMDVNQKQAFRTGDYRWQIRALDAMLLGLEKALVPFTLWNYSPLNSHDDGDLWYRENFSIWSRSHGREDNPQMTSRRGRESRALYYLDQSSAKKLDDQKYYRHGRCLESIIRPYAAKIAGCPRKMHFDRQSLQFRLEIELGHGIAKDTSNTTEIFLPRYHYKGLEAYLRIDVTSGHCSSDWANQTIRWTHHYPQQSGCASLHISVINPRSGKICTTATCWEDGLEFVCDIIEIYGIYLLYGMLLVGPLISYMTFMLIKNTAAM